MSAIITEQGDYIDNITKIPAPTGTSLVIYTADGKTTTYTYPTALLASLAHERLKSALMNQSPEPLYSNFPPPTITSVVGPPGASLCSPGDSVDISGTGFTEESIVLFGTSQCRVSFISSNKLTAIAPNGLTGSQDVTVLRLDGGSAYSAGGVTYIIPLIPTMTSDTTPSGTASSGGLTSSDAYKAFDGDNSTSWSAPTLPDFLRYQFTSPVVAKRYSVSFSPNITDHTLYGSNDGSSWTVLDNKISESAGVNYYSFSNTTAYSYYKITVGVGLNLAPIFIYRLQLYSE